MTQTQANDDGGGSTNTTRRGFVRLGIGATAAAATGIGAGSSPAAAQSCDPEQSLSCSYGDQPDYGISFFVGRVTDFFGQTGDEQIYDDKQEDQLYVQSRQDMTLIKSENDRTLTIISNIMSFAKSAAYQIGRKKFIEELNDGTDYADAKIAAENAITEWFVPRQKNLIDRWNTMLAQVELMINQADGLGIPSTNIIQHFYNASGNKLRNPISIKEGSQTLLDGSSMQTLYMQSTASYFGNTMKVKISGRNGGQNVDGSGLKTRIPANGNLGYGSSVDLFYHKVDGSRSDRHSRWQAVLDEISTKHDEAISEIRTFADGVAPKYQAGDIDTEDLVSPRDLWQMSSDDAETPYAAADLAGLGFEVNQDSSVVIKLLNDGDQIEGSVYLSKSPIGESLTVGNVYDPNLSRSTDADGNYTDSASDYSATASDPIPLDGLAFVAYNTDNGSTYDQIQQPFEVINAYGKDGEELQNVGYKPSKGQQTTTTDIDALREELQSMNDEIIELEEERRELATGGAPGGGGGSLGTLAAAGAVGALLLAVLGGGDN